MKTINLLKIVLLGAIWAISCMCVSSQTTYYWNFGTDSENPSPTPSETNDNLTVSDLSIGNSNGTVTAMLSTTSNSGTSYAGSSAQYNAGNAARTGELNTGADGSAYFEFTVTPAGNYSFELSDISFGTRSTGTGAAAYSLRSSADSYATDIASGDIATNSTWALKSNTNLTFEADVPVTFRIYGYGGTGNAGTGTINWRIDDLSVILTTTATGTTNPSLSVSPASLAFGSIITNTVSEAKTFTVSGTNLTGNISYTKTGTDANAFTITETTWSETDGGTLSVVFNPDQVKNYTASIVISSTGAQNKTIALTGAGVAPAVTGQTTYYWNFGTDSENPSPMPSETNDNLTVSDLSIGNSNGTVAAMLSTTSNSGTSYAGSSAQYNAGNAARTGELNTDTDGSAYFEFTVTPAGNYSFELSGISFGTRSTGTGAAAYSLRSSADGYATDIASGDIATNSTWALKTNAGLTFEATASVTFRIYGYGGTGNATAGTINWRIDDLSVILTASTRTSEPALLNEKLSVYAADNNIYLNNLSESSTIYVYNAAGQLVASQKASDSNVVLPALQKGVLMVKIVSGINVQAVKIINK